MHVQEQATALILTITDREKEVLLWIASGKTKSEIADLVYGSESCVKRHCENIFNNRQTVWLS